MPPRRCDRQNKTMLQQAVQQHKEKTTKIERNGQENRSTTKTPSRQPQEVVIRVAYSDKRKMARAVSYSHIYQLLLV